MHSAFLRIGTHGEHRQQKNHCGHHRGKEIPDVPVGLKQVIDQKITAADQQKDRQIDITDDRMEELAQLFLKNCFHPCGCTSCELCCA